MKNLSLMLPSPLFSPEHIFFEALNTIFNNLALDMQICRLHLQHTTSAETQSRCMFNEICRGKWSCGAKPHLAGMKVCVWIQKALLFSSSLPCGLFCCLFCLFQSGSCVWTAGREMHLTPLCEFRSCLRWALCRLWSWDGTLIWVPHRNVSKQVIALSLSFFCCL